jgi:hypothetical protein
VGTQAGAWDFVDAMLEFSAALHAIVEDAKRPLSEQNGTELRACVERARRRLSGEASPFIARSSR